MKAQKNAVDFVKFLAENPEVSQSLKTSNDQEGFLTEAVKLGEKKGYRFTMQDLKEQIDTLLGMLSHTLNDDQLELVAGGGNWFTSPQGEAVYKDLLALQNKTGIYLSYCPPFASF